jgi:hypothetical protein
MKRAFWRATLDHLRDNAFCSAPLATKSEFSSSAITIDIHLFDPDVGRGVAQFKEDPFEWSWILIGASGGGVKILNRPSILEHKLFTNNHLNADPSCSVGA